MASSCSECNNLFESKNKIKRWARTKRDAHTRKEGTGKCVRCFNKNRRREQRKNARKRVHSDDEDVDADPEWVEYSDSQWIATQTIEPEPEKPLSLEREPKRKPLSLERKPSKKLTLDR